MQDGIDMIRNGYWAMVKLPRVRRQMRRWRTVAVILGLIALALVLSGCVLNNWRPIRADIEKGTYIRLSMTFKEPSPGCWRSVDIDFGDLTKPITLEGPECGYVNQLGSTRESAVAVGRIGGVHGPIRVIHEYPNDNLLYRPKATWWDEWGHPKEVKGAVCVNVQ